MAEMKQYVILGLVIFGSTIAKTLSQYNLEVIAIDKDLACVDRVNDFVPRRFRQILPILISCGRLAFRIAMRRS
ncbi:MAG: hypothetical protein ACLSA6_01160 [Holdemania massiliensis]